MEHKITLRFATPQEHDYILMQMSEELERLQQAPYKKIYLVLGIISVVIGVVALFNTPLVGFFFTVAAVLFLRCSFYQSDSVKTLKRHLQYTQEGKYKVLPVTGYGPRVQGVNTSYCFYETGSILDDNPVEIPYLEAKRLVDEGIHEFPLLLLSFPGEYAMPALPAPRSEEVTALV